MATVTTVAAASTEVAVKAIAMVANTTDRRPLMFFRIFPAIMLSVLLGTVAFADNGFKEGGKEVGQGFRKIGKTTAKAAKTTGKAFHKAGKATGKAFQKAGKETGEAVKGK